MVQKPGDPDGQTRIDPRNVYIGGRAQLDSQAKPISGRKKDKERGKDKDKPEGPASVDEINEEQRAVQVAEVKEAFDQLHKSIKQIQLYRHNTAAYPEYIERAYKVFARLLDKYESLPFKVEQLGFKYQGEIIYQEDASEQNLAHKFYRDGIRILIFRRGMTPEELLDLALIMLTNFRLSEFMFEDMVSLMWKQEFANIEYVVVETFAVGTEGESEARVEVDKIVNYLYERLTGQTVDAIQFARISLEDLEIELDDVESAKGVVVKGAPATSEQKTKVQQELEEEDDTRLLPKLVQILFRVLEEELDQDLGAALEGVFAQLLDSFLMHEDFRGINQMLRKFKNMGRRQLPPGNLARIQQIEQQFVARMGESERIERVGTIVDGMAEIREPQEVYRYLTRLDEQALLPLLQTLENMERQEARRLFCDALATLGKEQLEVFVRRLESNRANLVRDMVYVVDKLNPPDKLKILARLLDHPNLAIRLETLATLGSSGDEACRPYVIKALEDEEMQMRMTAARLLVNFDIVTATKMLLAIVQHPEFIKRDNREQASMFAALASTNADAAMDFFRDQLHATSLVAKKRLTEYKRTMVTGLSLSGSIAAYKLLKSELEAGIKEEEVSEAAERAVAKLREKLLGAG